MAGCLLAGYLGRNSPRTVNTRFDVDHSTIRQGNAVVAVLDASGMIMWSWHIWVTDYVPGDGLKKVTNYQGYNTIYCRCTSVGAIPKP